MSEIDKLFDAACKHKASDIFLKYNMPPTLRITGTLREMEMQALNDDNIRKLVYSMLTPEQVKAFEENSDLDMAYATDTTRFRVNLFRQRGHISMVARRVNNVIPSFEDLHLPAIFAKVAMYPNGLVLVCGVTGSGKSTSLAAMIQYINTNRKCHVVTIEDPIEYVYSDEKAIINQREVGLDVKSFKIALKSVVRQNPDVILIGEMRDAETFGTAVEAAATGHLVFGTLHSGTVPQTFSRIYDIFPQDEREGVRRSLMYNLKAVVCQKLAPTKDGKSRVPAVEIMIMNPAIQKLIEEGEEKKIGDVLRVAKAEGMCDFNTSLMELIKTQYISDKTGFSLSPNPDQLKMNLKGIFVSDAGITS
jgi:twitching motility protein PilT